MITDQPQSFDVVKNMLQAAWGLSRGFEMKRMGNNIYSFFTLQMQAIVGEFSRVTRPWLLDKLSTDQEFDGPGEATVVKNGVE